MTGGDARDGEQGEPDQPPSLLPDEPDVPDGLRRRGRFRVSGPVVRLRRHRSTEEHPEHPGHSKGEKGESAEGRRIGRARAFLGAVTDRIIETAPRIPVRDLATLRAQFPGLGPEEIADQLVDGAVKGTATVGAGVGAAAMMPVPPAMPAELTAEIVGVASVELKLIAELHEVYGRRPPGNGKQRATAYLGAWTSERGIDVVRPMTLNAALGGQLKREMRQQLLKRTARTLPNLAPFMIGAVVGAVMNRRDTKKIAGKIREDLRSRAVPWDRLPSQRYDLPHQPAQPDGPGNLPCSQGRTSLRGGDEPPPQLPS